MKNEDQIWKNYIGKGHHITWHSDIKEYERRRILRPKPTIDNRKYKEKLRGTLVRVYCGLEHTEDQTNDILEALKFLK